MNSFTLLSKTTHSAIDLKNTIELFLPGHITFVVDDFYGYNSEFKISQKVSTYKFYKFIRKNLYFYLRTNKNAQLLNVNLTIIIFRSAFFFSAFSPIQYRFTPPHRTVHVDLLLTAICIFL